MKTAKKWTAKQRMALSGSRKGEKNGMFGKKHSEESKRKMGLKHKGCFPSAEARKKMSAAHKGFRHSEESKKRISAALKGRVVSEEWKRKNSEAHKGKKHSEEAKRKISAAMSGSNNPRYGKPISDAQRKALDHTGKKLSAAHKKKISAAKSGKNNPNYGKVAAKGAGNGWSGWYKGWYFRSLGELRYVIEEVEARGFRWEGAEYRYKFYYRQNGVSRTYRPDLLVNGNCLIEIKPKCFRDDEIVRLKIKAGRKACTRLGLRFVVVNSTEISFDKLRELVESGQVRLIKRWAKKYQKRLGRQAA